MFFSAERAISEDFIGTLHRGGVVQRRTAPASSFNGSPEAGPQYCSADAENRRQKRGMKLMRHGA